jgi:diacylglycerol kinase (ATP)
MKITLIHNPGAGDGQDVMALVRLITDAGHDLRYRSTKQDWKELLRKPADLVVAAGGDGTVRRVALEAAARCLPFSAIPLGTANNIAKTVGLLGEAADLIETWSPSPGAEHPFDLGEVDAPWGTKRFVEGVGAGLVADLIEREDEIAADAKLLGRATDRALHLLSVLVREEPVRRWKIRADGRDLTGDYFSVEVLNTRFVGPNLPLAEKAFPGDGLLDVVLLRAADREPLHSYLESRLHLASGRMPKLKTVRASEIEIGAPAGIRWHLDDHNWPSAEPVAEKSTLTVRCLAGALKFVAAQASFSDSPQAKRPTGA